MGEKITKQKMTNVRSHVRRQRGKLVKVQKHVRHVEKTVEIVSKQEYRNNFKGRPAKEKSRDIAKTKANAIPRSSNKAELPLNWTSKKMDWIGVDGNGNKAPKKAKMPKQLKHSESTRYDDAGYDKKAYHDSSLSRHENEGLARSRMSLREMSTRW